MSSEVLIERVSSSFKRLNFGLQSGVSKSPFWSMEQAFDNSKRLYDHKEIGSADLQDSDYFVTIEAYFDNGGRLAEKEGSRTVNVELDDSVFQALEGQSRRQGKSVSDYLRFIAQLFASQDGASPLKISVGTKPVQIRLTQEQVAAIEAQSMAGASANAWIADVVTRLVRGGEFRRFEKPDVRRGRPSRGSARAALVALTITLPVDVIQALREEGEAHGVSISAQVKAIALRVLASID